MPSVQQPRRAPEFVPGKRNQLTGITPAQLYAVSFVNGDSQKSMALVLVFGKDTEDGGPGVFVLADENEMSTQLKIATEMIKKGVRAHLAKQRETTADEVPGTAIDLVGTGESGPASAGPADITNLVVGG